MVTLEYKCKRCGKVSATVEVTDEVGNEVIDSKSYAIPEFFKTQSPHYQAKKNHVCADGGVGLVEIVGLAAKG